VELGQKGNIAHPGYSSSSRHTGEELPPGRA